MAAPCSQQGAVAGTGFDPCTEEPFCGTSQTANGRPAGLSWRFRPARGKRLRRKPPYRLTWPYPVRACPRVDKNRRSEDTAPGALPSRHVVAAVRVGPTVWDTSLAEVGVLGLHVLAPRPPPHHCNTERTAAVGMRQCFSRSHNCQSSMTSSARTHIWG